MPFKPPGQCPACGEWVPKGAAACEECGACAKSGWKDDAEVYDGLDLPDEEFDYDDFVAREFGGKSRSKGVEKSLWWWVALALVILMMLGFLLRGSFF